MLNIYSGGLFAEDGVYNEEYVLAVKAMSKYDTSKDGIAYSSRNKLHSFYFVPETHPLFNTCLIINHDDMEDEKIRRVAMKQLKALK